MLLILLLVIGSNLSSRRVSDSCFCVVSGFGKRTPSRDTPPGSPARGSRSPLASYFAKRKVESSESSPSSNDHTNGNFFSRLSPLQGRKNEPSSNVDSLPVSPSLALYSGGDYFARRVRISSYIKE